MFLPLLSPLSENKQNIKKQKTKTQKQTEEGRHPSWYSTPATRHVSEEILDFLAHFVLQLDAPMLREPR